MTDEDLHNGCDAGGVTILRVSPDLTEATELAEWFVGAGTPAPVCSSHVFSTRGHHMFMGSYNAGLQVIDLSDPANPTKAGEHILAGANSWGRSRTATTSTSETSEPAGWTSSGTPPEGADATVG